jgi:eukaryotic-like serine/threonine-protein kinase
VKGADIVRITRASAEGAVERLSPRARRNLSAASAVLAAIICAAVVANFIVMPIIVKRGDLVAAPDLIGRPLAEAQRLLAEARLNLRVTDERPDPTYPGGRVVRQTPEPGVDVKRGRTVTVTVSTGLDLRAVPALAGLPERQAELELTRVGLVVGDVLEVTSDRVDRGRVIGSTPGEGTLAPVGDGITLLVSLGRRPAELSMPLLVGLGPDEARAVAQGLGLVVRSVTYGKGDRGARFREVVIMQDPPAGTKVMEGEGVTLRIGRD